MALLKKSSQATEIKTFFFLLNKFLAAAQLTDSNGLMVFDFQVLLKSGRHVTLTVFGATIQVLKSFRGPHNTSCMSEHKDV